MAGEREYLQKAGIERGAIIAGFQNAFIQFKEYENNQKQQVFDNDIKLKSLALQEKQIDATITTAGGRDSLANQKLNLYGAQLGLKEQQARFKNEMELREANQAQGKLNLLQALDPNLDADQNIQNFESLTAPRTEADTARQRGLDLLESGTDPVTEPDLPEYEEGSAPTSDAQYDADMTGYPNRTVDAEAVTDRAVAAAAAEAKRPAIDWNSDKPYQQAEQLNKLWLGVANEGQPENQQMANARQAYRKTLDTFKIKSGAVKDPATGKWTTRPEAPAAVRQRIQAHEDSVDSLLNAASLAQGSEERKLLQENLMDLGLTAPEISMGVASARSKIEQSKQLRSQASIIKDQMDEVARQRSANVDYADKIFKRSAGGTLPTELQTEFNKWQTTQSGLATTYDSLSKQYNDLLSAANAQQAPLSKEATVQTLFNPTPRPAPVK